jgi:hypothetical protein
MIHTPHLAGLSHFISRKGIARAGALALTLLATLFGFPFSVDGGQRWPTNWFLTAIAEMTARPKTGVFKRNGSVSVFADPSAAQADFTLPFRAESARAISSVAMASRTGI